MISDHLHAKIVKAGLAKSRSTLPSLRPYFKAYIARRTDLKPRSIINLECVQKCADVYFGDKPMIDITRGDVQDYKRWLLARFSRATAAMHIKRMRQVFADAIDHKLFTDNPFKSVKAGSQVNAERSRYIPAATIDTVIRHCPSIEWKLLFALARFAGLRVQSETTALRWADVDFEAARLNVRASKTDSRRFVPISPELMPLLLEAHELSEDGAVYVLVKLRGPNASTTGRKIIDRAGFKAWPKLFQNLRASCETDFASILPIHAACAMIGNSTGIAMKHYLQVTDNHFQVISGKGAAIRAARSGDVSGVKAGANAPGDAAGLVDYPLGEQNYPRILIGNIQKAHRATQNALHAAHGAIARERKRLIRNLSAAVASAKGGGR
jgi:integrase